MEQGDVAVIAGREHPRAVVNKRRQLEARIQKHGFEQTMEAMAYTWFNRIVAIRFMELPRIRQFCFTVARAMKANACGNPGTRRACRVSRLEKGNYYRFESGRK